MGIGMKMPPHFVLTLQSVHLASVPPDDEKPPVLKILSANITVPDLRNGRWSGGGWLRRSNGHSSSQEPAVAGSPSSEARASTTVSKGQPQKEVRGRLRCGPLSF
ncbi:unnamed protein product [Arctogadus glacialis]